MANGVELDKSEISRETLEIFEKKVMSDFPKFMSLDLASIVSSFLMLHYIPRTILNELNQI
jgi:hypothetical protein